MYSRGEGLYAVAAKPNIEMRWVGEHFALRSFRASLRRCFANAVVM